MQTPRQQASKTQIMVAYELPAAQLHADTVIYIQEGDAALHWAVAVLSCAVSRYCAYSPPADIMSIIEIEGL